MYLPSESTHRGSPLVAVHAHQPLLVGARAKGSTRKEVMQLSRVEHTSFGVLGSLAKAGVEAGESCEFGTNSISGDLGGKLRKRQADIHFLLIFALKVNDAEWNQKPQEWKFSFIECLWAPTG